MGLTIDYMHFCIYAHDLQYPVAFPGHGAKLGNTKGQTHCFVNIYTRLQKIC